MGVVRNLHRLSVSRNNTRLVVTFGETPLFATYLVALIVNAPFSVGVRSNVPRRMQLRQQALSVPKRWLAKLKGGLKLRIFRFVYKRAAQVVVQTELAAEEFCQQYGISPKRVWALGNNLPEKFAERAAGHEREYHVQPLRLLFIGNASTIKGLDVLREVLHRFSDVVSSVTEVTIVGPGTTGALENTQTGLAVNCFERREDIFELMMEHDLLVVPSREDQFPNVVLEALAVGLPVIGSNVDGIHVMLEDESLLFAPGSSAALAERLEAVSTAEGYAKAIELARQRRDVFDFEWAAEYEAILAQAAKQDLQPEDA